MNEWILKCWNVKQRNITILKLIADPSYIESEKEEKKYTLIVLKRHSDKYTYVRHLKLLRVIGRLWCVKSS